MNKIINKPWRACSMSFSWVNSVPINALNVALDVNLSGNLEFDFLYWIIVVSLKDASLQTQEFTEYIGHEVITPVETNDDSSIGVNCEVLTPILAFLCCRDYCSSGCPQSQGYDEQMFYERVFNFHSLLFT